MSTISSAELISSLGVGKRQFSEWYRTAEGAHFLEATDRGRLMFTWEAVYNDGSTVRQYDDVTFARALRDEEFVPPFEALISTDALDKNKVVRFTLFPIAYTRKNAPWFQRPIEVQVRLDRRERFIGRWLVDFVVQSGNLLRRHVIGISREIDFFGNKQEVQSFVVVSPSGMITLGGDEDKSFEGE